MAKLAVRWQILDKAEDQVELVLFSRPGPQAWAILVMTEDQLEQLAHAIRKYKSSY